MRKKNDKIYYTCIKFWNLNKAYLKNVFMLPITKLIIDNALMLDMFLFMDESSKYK